MRLAATWQLFYAVVQVVLEGVNARLGYVRVLVQVPVGVEPGWSFLEHRFGKFYRRCHELRKGESV